MTELRLLEALGLGEEKDWEFKSAKGGVPASMWETYSAMANTDGGTIVLGVGEKNGHCFIEGLDKPEQHKKKVWDVVNDRGKVSVNLLVESNVSFVKSGEKTVLVVQVPRAARRQRPVYVGQNPLTGTYRRNYEGDYHCTPDEVGRMLADQAEEPADSRILEGFGLDDLDPASLQQYRQRFSARFPDHPWLAKDTQGLLVKLGGWRRDRPTKTEGLTVAGLLMFGKDDAIADPAALSQYQVDYREKLSDDPKVRWTDRITIDGTWVANLFQFYQRVYQRLAADLKIPFQLGPDLHRKDDTIVHEAIREALANALIHADYRGMGGIVIEKYRSRFELSNPGSLLVSTEQLIRGGVSECRNKSLQKMFQYLGRGEKAGSGIDKIRQGWASQQWIGPSIEETVQPDRVRLVLPMVSLLPEDSITRLRRRFGKRLDQLGPLEMQSLVTADLEKTVSNARLRLDCDEHSADLTKMFRGLVAQGFLERQGQKRWTFYQLPRSPYSDNAVPSHGADSQHKGDSQHNGGKDSQHKAEELTGKELAELEAIAQRARVRQRLTREETRGIILRLCAGRFLTVVQIAGLMNRHPVNLRDRFVTSMVEEGLLVRKFPQDPNRPDQAYKTKTY